MYVYACGCERFCVDLCGNRKHICIYMDVCVCVCGSSSSSIKRIAKRVRGNWQILFDDKVERQGFLDGNKRARFFVLS